MEQLQLAVRALAASPVPSVRCSRACGAAEFTDSPENLGTISSRHSDSALIPRVIANDIDVKDIIKRIDLDQLTPPRLTAHLSDGLRSIFLIRKEIGMYHDARPTDSA